MLGIIATVFEATDVKAPGVVKVIVKQSILTGDCWVKVKVKQSRQLVSGRQAA
jgi:hypothetical protein